MLNSLIESVCDYVSPVVFEHQLRREFRKPFGKGVEATGRWPKLNGATSARLRAKIIDKSKVGTAKDLSKEMAHAKRRNLCVIGSTTSDGIVVFGKFTPS